MLNKLIDYINKLPLKYQLECGLTTGWVDFKKENRLLIIEAQKYFCLTPDKYDFRIKENQFILIVKTNGSKDK